jgi:hypothetical protein
MKEAFSFGKSAIKQYYDDTGNEKDKIEVEYYFSFYKLFKHVCV